VKCPSSKYAYIKFKKKSSGLCFWGDLTLLQTYPKPLIWDPWLSPWTLPSPHLVVLCRCLPTHLHWAGGGAPFNLFICPLIRRLSVITPTRVNSFWSERTYFLENVTKIGLLLERLCCPQTAHFVYSISGTHMSPRKGGVAGEKKKAKKGIEYRGWSE